MPRDLRILSASVHREQGGPARVVLSIESADLRSRPVHAVELDPMHALTLADNLLRSARIVLGEAR